MAPAIATLEGENKINAILAFARDLEDKLHETEASKSLKPHLYKEIEKLSLLHHKLVSKRRLDFDGHGTRLWNLASKLDQQPSRDTELLCSVRVFAFLLVDFAGRDPTCYATDEIRILKTALKTTKYCLEEKQLALAEIVIERAAYCHERLNETTDQKILAEPLTLQYLIARVALAWRQGRLDIAKLMLAKINTINSGLSLQITEELSDLSFEIGKGLLARSQWVEASFWLEVAYDRLAAFSTETTSSQVEELRMCVMHSMVRSLIPQSSEAARNKAWRIFHELHSQSGIKLVVLLLKLDLLTTDTDLNVASYGETLGEIAGIVHLTDSTLSTILHHVHKLQAWDPVMTHALLFKFLEERLLGSEQQLWFEKTLITIVWNCATSNDFSDAPTALKETFDVVNEPKRVVSESAIHAAQILMWRRIESAYGLKLFELTESWCRLSLHDIFGGSGNLNSGKFQRRLILCSLAMSNAAAALEVFATMSEANRNDALTQYLLYKVALQCRDTDLAVRCLNSISSDSTKDRNLLYACVLEAQRIADEGQVITALQPVLEWSDHSQTTDVHFPALLRCNARLLMRSVDKLEDHAVDSLCKVFERAATHAKIASRQDKDTLFTVNELDWFSRNCYNLSLHACHTWPPNQTLRLLQALLAFIDLYPTDLEPTVLEDLSLRRLFCNFVHCLICVHLARNEDIVETQLQHYVTVRQSASEWRSHRRHQVFRLEDNAQSDFALKHITLLAYDFEAAARLSVWHDFDNIITECEKYKDTKVFATFADIVLASEAPSAVVIESLRRIINTSWQVETIDIGTLSRWIRCLMTKALDTDMSTAETVLGQAIHMAHAADENSDRSAQYPAEEVEWLATTVFNRAIDFYCSSRDDHCRRWAGYALDLGALCRDGGLLHSVLQGKFQSLVLNAQ